MFAPAQWAVTITLACHATSRNTVVDFYYCTLQPGLWNGCFCSAHSASERYVSHTIEYKLHLSGEYDESSRQQDMARGRESGSL
jgi:hypothetical protein